MDPIPPIVSPNPFESASSTESLGAPASTLVSQGVPVEVKNDSPATPPVTNRGRRYEIRMKRREELELLQQELLDPQATVEEKQRANASIISIEAADPTLNTFTDDERQFIQTFNSVNPRSVSTTIFQPSLNPPGNLQPQSLRFGTPVGSSNIPIIPQSAGGAVGNIIGSESVNNSSAGSSSGVNHPSVPSATVAASADQHGLNPASVGQFGQNIASDRFINQMSELVSAFRESNVKSDSIPAKDIKLEGKLSIILKSEDSLDVMDFIGWDKSIKEHLSTVKGFLSIFTEPPLVSWERFRSFYPRYSLINQQSGYIQAHQNICVWVGDQIKSDINLRWKNELDNDSSQWNLMVFLNFPPSVVDSTFRRNAYSFYQLIKKRMLPDSIVKSSRIMETRASLPSTYHSFKSPIDYIRKFQDLVYAQSIIVKNGPVFTEPYLVNECIAGIPDVDIQLQVANRTNAGSPIVDFENLKQLVTLIHDAKRKAPSSKGRSSHEEKKGKKSKPKGSDQKSKEKSKEKSEHSGKTEEKKSKGGSAKSAEKRYCFDYNSDKGCSRENCKYLHETMPDKLREKLFSSSSSSSDELSFVIQELSLALKPPVLNTALKPYDFILDSGSAGNYTGCKSLLDDLGTIDPITISTIAGNRTVKESGVIQLTKKIKINDVRYVEGSPYSLLSLSKFTDAGYPVVFFKDLAVVLNKTRQEALYKFCDNKVILQFNRKAKMWVRAPVDATEKNIPIEIAKPSPAAKKAPPPAAKAPPPVAVPLSKATASIPKHVQIAKNDAVIPAHVTWASRLNHHDHDDDDDEKSTVEISALIFENANIEEVNFGNSALDFHYRLNHPPNNALVRANSTFGMGFKPDELELVKDSCLSCISAKMTRRPIGSRIISQVREAIYPMDCWHADVVGPINGLIDDEKVRTPSLTGNNYSLNMADETTIFCFVIPIQSKSDVPQHIKRVVIIYQTKTERKLKRFRSDGGGEFVNDELKKFFAENGTEFVVSSPDTPELNGLPERLNRSLLDPARASIIHCGGPANLWDHAMVYQGFIKNRLPTDDQKFPISEIDPTWRSENIMKAFYPFGCDVEYLLDKDKITKMGPRSHPGVFLGYSEMYNTNLILIEKKDGSFAAIACRSIKVLNSFKNVQSWKERIIDQAEYRISPEEREFEVDSIYADRTGKDGKRQYLVKWKFYKNPSWESEANVKNAPLAIERYWKSDLPLSKPKKKKAVEPSSLVGIMIEEACLTTLQDPDYDYVIPNNYREAQNHPDKDKWNEAIDSENNSLIKNGVFVETYCPEDEDIKPITSRYVFAVKRDAFGRISRWKTRAVARGFSQQQGIDYSETFSPTSRWKALKILFQLAAQYDWEIKQFDFETAFLNAELKEKIYMKPPEGYVPTLKGKNVVLLLKKSLYGLKQASREWWLMIDKFLRELGYTTSPHDECIYFRVVENSRIFVSVYVDDLLAFYPIALESHWLSDKEKFSLNFKIKDLGDCEWILNMSIIRNRQQHEIILSQAPYIRQILARFDFAGEIPRTQPYFRPDITVCPDGIIPLKLDAGEMKLYQSIVGSLLYAANFTRVDISFITNCLARYMHEAYNYHLQAAYHVLRYLVGTTDKAMIFKSAGPRSEKNEIIIYSDSDYAGSKDDRISVSGYISVINESIIHWASKKQKTVALSSTESELYALHDAVREALYLRNWFEFYLDETIVVKILCDNQSMMKIADHGTNHDRTKHIHVRYLSMRENLKSGEIVLEYVPTAENLADILTKCTNGPRFRLLSSQLLVDYEILDNK
jgi:hypothetical protein